MIEGKVCSKIKETLCPAMYMFAGFQNGRGKRIFTAQTYNHVTGREGSGVYYQWTNKASDFVALNFCPWCAGVLGSQQKPKRAKAKRE